MLIKTNDQKQKRPACSSLLHTKAKSIVLCEELCLSIPSSLFSLLCSLLQDSTLDIINHQPTNKTNQSIVEEKVEVFYYFRKNDSWRETIRILQT